MADIPSGDNKNDQIWKFEPSETVPPVAPIQPEIAQDNQAEVSTTDVPVTASIPPLGYSSDTPPAQGVNIEDGEVLVTWTASEFIAHEKSLGWYGALLLVTLLICFLVWAFTKSIFSVVVVLLCGAALGYFGSHKPRQLHYQIDGEGLTIENKFYDYGGFMSFSVLPEGAISSIIFLSHKRFLPPLTIYYDPADEQKIIDTLSARIPLEPGRRDAIDRLITRIRF